MRRVKIQIPVDACKESVIGMYDLLQELRDATRYLNIEQKDFSQRTLNEAALEQLRAGRLGGLSLGDAILSRTYYLGTDRKQFADLTSNEWGIEHLRRKVRLELYGLSSNRLPGAAAPVKKKVNG